MLNANTFWAMRVSELRRLLRTKTDAELAQQYCLHPGTIAQVRQQVREGTHSLRRPRGA